MIYNKTSYKITVWLGDSPVKATLVVLQASAVGRGADNVEAEAQVLSVGKILPFKHWPVPQRKGEESNLKPSRTESGPLNGGQCRGEVGGAKFKTQPAGAERAGARAGRGGGRAGAAAGSKKHDPWNWKHRTLEISATILMSGRSNSFIGGRQHAFILIR